MLLKKIFLENRNIKMAFKKTQFYSLNFLNIKFRGKGGLFTYDFDSRWLLFKKSFKKAFLIKICNNVCIIPHRKTSTIDNHQNFFEYHALTRKPVRARLKFLHPVCRQLAKNSDFLEQKRHSID